MGDINVMEASDSTGGLDAILDGGPAASAAIEAGPGGAEVAEPEAGG
jgi:hypothetical protein